jgi:hypothetical protein
MCFGPFRVLRGQADGTYLVLVRLGWAVHPRGYTFGMFLLFCFIILYLHISIKN